jgi:hypothetical protein
MDYFTTGKKHEGKSLSARSFEVIPMGHPSKI